MSPFSYLDLLNGHTTIAHVPKGNGQKQVMSQGQEGLAHRLQPLMSYRCQVLHPDQYGISFLELNVHP